MADEQRNQMVRELLLEPIPLPAGWTSEPREWTSDRPANAEPWAITVVYLATKGQDVAKVPLSISMVEIEHYQNDDQLREQVRELRNGVERRLRVLIAEREAHREG